MFIGEPMYTSALANVADEWNNAHHSKIYVRQCLYKYEHESGDNAFDIYTAFENHEDIWKNESIVIQMGQSPGGSLGVSETIALLMDFERHLRKSVDGEWRVNVEPKKDGSFLVIWDPVNLPKYKNTQVHAHFYKGRELQYTFRAKWAPKTPGKKRNQITITHEKSLENLLCLFTLHNKDGYSIVKTKDSYKLVGN